MARSMAYIFELDTELPTAPFVDVWDTEILEFALGYDIDAEIVVLMSVMLVPGGSYLDDKLEGVFDLRFGIRERDAKHEWKVSPPNYTRECADKYIPKEQRKAVTDLLCQALGVLTKHSDAKHLTMETFYANLPDKALGKYKEICNFLVGCGFELKDEFRDEESGKNYWLLGSVPIESEA
jgi:hypothetical protein